MPMCSRLHSTASSPSIDLGISCDMAVCNFLLWSWGGGMRLRRGACVLSCPLLTVVVAPFVGAKPTCSFPLSFSLARAFATSAINFGCHWTWSLDLSLHAVLPCTLAFPRTKGTFHFYHTLTSSIPLLRQAHGSPSFFFWPTHLYHRSVWSLIFTTCPRPCLGCPTGFQRGSKICDAASVGSFDDGSQSSVD